MRLRKTLLAAALSLAMIVPAALAGDHPDDKAKQAKDVATVDMTVEGKVERVFTREMKGEEMLLLHLDTDAAEWRDDYTVCLGAAETAKRDEMKLEKGDEIKIAGVMKHDPDGKTMFIAHELHRGDHHWKMNHQKDMHRMM